MPTLTVSLFLAGLNPNVNVSSMDVTGGLAVKDPSQSQSRLPQWTHPNPMDNVPGAASPLDQNPGKHGTAEPRCPWAPRTTLISLLMPRFSSENSVLKAD